MDNNETSRMTRGETLTAATKAKHALPNVADLFHEYMRYARANLKTSKRIEGIYRRYLSRFSDVPALNLTVCDVESLQDSLAQAISPKTANSVTELISTMYNRAHEFGLIPEYNPVRGLSKFSIEHRARKLEPDEMPRFFKALAELKNDVVRDYFLICILTGELKSRILEMRWQDIDLQRGVWFIRQRTSRSSNPVVFLQSGALEILRKRKASAINEWVFPSICELKACLHPCGHVSKTGHLEDPDKSWASLLKRSEIQNLRLNDLRNSRNDLHLVREAMAEFLLLTPPAPHVLRVIPQPKNEVAKQRKELAFEALAKPVERAELPLHLLELSPVDRTSKSPTFAAAYEYYMQHHANQRKTANQIRANYRRYLRGIAERPVDQITVSDVLALRDFMGEHIGRAAANRALEIISAVYNKCRKWGFIEVQNPADAVSVFALEARDRFLSTEELSRFHKALERCKRPTFKAWVLLCLYTGARESNVRAMRWQDIDLAARTWRIPITKSGKPHVVPLIQEAIDVIEGQRGLHLEWVLPGTGNQGYMSRHNRAWAALLKDAELDPDTHIHDLRRTMGSWQAKTGSTLHVIGKTLGHTNSSATAIYARLDVESIRASMEKAVRGMVGEKEEKPAINLPSSQLDALAESLAAAIAARLKTPEEAVNAT